MLILVLNPLSKSVAIGEMLIILIVAALIGYVLARLIGQSQIRLLEDEIAEKQIKLTACRAIPATPVRQTTTPTAVASKGALRTVYPTLEPELGVGQDLKLIEGIGPKIEEILNKHGIINYEALSAVPAVRIAAILRGAGPRFQLHDPTSWPEQASLAHEGKWEKLNALKEQLIAGKTE